MCHRRKFGQFSRKKIEYMIHPALSAKSDMVLTRVMVKVASYSVMCMCHRPKEPEVSLTKRF